MDRARPLRRTVAPVRVTAVRDRDRFERADRLATEEPLEIRAAGRGQEPVSVAVIMRTPGHDFELAAGFLYTEGLVRSGDDVLSVAYCDLPAEEQQYNVVTVKLAVPFDQAALGRNFYATSSCGVCGKASLEQIRVRCEPLASGPAFPASVVVGLPDALRGAQRIFEQTGGLHAAGLFDRVGSPVAVREDIGRHNAVDKLVGWAFQSGALPLADVALMVSGRVSFEIVQKAATAGIAVLCAVSAPSSLAVETAEELGMTVVGFVRDRGFNVYTHPERIEAAGKVLVE